MITTEQIQLRLSTLSGLMEAKSPGYVSELDTIRNLLHRDPEQLALLDPEKDLSVLFAAMGMYRQIEIPEAAKKKEKSKLIPKDKVIGTDDF